jgi:hypothetical protein
MATYTGTGNFSSAGSAAYRLDVTVVTTAVTGGTQLNISATATRFSTVVTPAFSDAGTRGYSVPGGRASSTSGSLLESGSANWTYDFRTGNTQTVWSGFNRFVASSYGSNTSVTITAQGSGSTFLQSASVTVNVPLTISYNYALDYNANGGTGTTSSTITTSTSTSVNLTAANNGFTRSGYNFTGWNTAANGSGTAYAQGASVSLTSSSPTLDLFAQWALNVPAPVFTSDLPNYTIRRVGDGIFDYFFASNSPTYSVASNPAISGLKIWENGTYVTTTSGAIPFASTPAEYTITVTATNDGGSDTTSDTFTLRAAVPSWVDTTLSNARVGASYTSGNTFSASGASSWSISGLPPGLTTSGTNTSTVTISGTPTTAGSYTISATPYNSDGTTTLDAGSTQSISLTVLPRVPVWVDQSIDTNAIKGVAYSDTISANFVTTWNDGVLPTGGLSFSGTTSATSTGIGTISGTPTAQGTINFTITPSNSAGETPGGWDFSINVSDAPLVWSDQILTSSIATQDEAYADGVSVQSGPTATYTVFSGSLPPGITLNSSTGAISGTPTTPGKYPFIIRATNLSNETLNTQTLTITVESAGGYVQVKTAGGWQNATVFVKTANGWEEGQVNAKSPTGWGPSFSS